MFNLLKEGAFKQKHLKKKGYLDKCCFPCT